MYSDKNNKYILTGKKVYLHESDDPWYSHINMNNEVLIPGTSNNNPNPNPTTQTNTIHSKNIETQGFISKINIDIIRNNCEIIIMILLIILIKLIW
jgi:hypothetical protein